MKHFLFDLETMGTDTSSCAVIDCSMIIFDTEKMLSDKPYTMRSIADVKRLKVSVKEQVTKYGWKIEDSTLKFWESLPEEARNKIQPKSTDLSVEDFTYQFIQYLIDGGRIERWWSRANTFDPMILWRIFSAVGKLPQMEAHLTFHKVRDIRTFIDAKLDFPKVNSFVPVSDEEFWTKFFVPHDSSWDVLADLLRFQAILRAEADLKMIEK